MIISALERHKGNRRVAAKELEISERTLYRKIKEFGLQESKTKPGPGRYEVFSEF